MLTYLALVVLVPLGLWVLGLLVDVAVERRYQAARERDRRVAEILLAQWLKLGEPVDLNPEEVLREAERIIGGGR